MIEVVLLAQGNELTTGQTVDTNSNWLATKLWALGLTVRRVICAPDRMDDLVEILRDSARLAAVVISTGGLGPTRDDLTAEAVSRAFAQPLRLDEGAMAQVEARYRTFNRTMPEVNRKQAILPEGARVLENRWGTAPAFSVEAEGAILYFMPGVPREMRPIFETWIEPDLVARLAIAKPTLHTIRVIGLGESNLEELLREIELPGLTIGFRTKLPENQVKLVFDPGVSEQDRRETVARARSLIGRYAYGVDSGDLAEVVGEALVARDQTLALAESCTGGAVAAWLTDVSGSSRYLLEGAVVYSNAAKTRAAGVDPALIEAHGAVSEPVAIALAEGIRARVGSTWGVGITGIAGPGGGSEEKPVGTVHWAVAGPEGTRHRRARFPGDRSRVRSFAGAAALMELLGAIRPDYFTSKG